MTKSPRKVIKKNVQTDKVCKDKHTVQNCYSITIRPGNGIDLGSDSVSKVIVSLEAISKYCVLTQEFEGETSHFQGGIFCDPPIRQDKLREKLVVLSLQIFEDNCLVLGNLVTTKQQDAVRKHSVMVKPHNDFDILVRYCMKAPIKVFVVKLHKSLFTLMPEWYCSHENPLNHPSYITDCPKCYRDNGVAKFYSDEEIFVQPLFPEGAPVHLEPPARGSPG